MTLRVVAQVGFATSDNPHQHKDLCMNNGFLICDIQRDDAFPSVALGLLQKWHLITSVAKQNWLLRRKWLILMQSERRLALPAWKRYSKLTSHSLETSQEFSSLPGENGCPAILQPGTMNYNPTTSHLLAIFLCSR